MLKDSDEVGFFEALFGLLLTPGSVAKTLYSKYQVPPYVVTFYLLLFITIFVPIATQILTMNLGGYELDIVIGISIIVVFTILTFVLFEAIFLQVMGLNVPIDHLLSAIAYSLVPVIVVTWVFFLANFFVDGGLSIVTIILTGYGELSPMLKNFLPWAAGVAQLGVLCTFYSCIKNIGDLHGTTALLAGVMSLVPLYIAFLIAVMVSEYIMPGTIGSISQAIPGFDALRDLYDHAFDAYMNSSASG